MGDGGTASGWGSPGGNKEPPKMQTVFCWGLAAAAGGMPVPARSEGCCSPPGEEWPATACGRCWISRCPHPLSPPVFFPPLGVSGAEVPWKVARVQRSSDFMPQKRLSAAPASVPVIGRGVKQRSSCRILGRDVINCLFAFQGQGNVALCPTCGSL